MPSLSKARVFNANALKNLSPKALIMGGTAGIGENIAMKLAAYSQNPHIIISGRKRGAAEVVIKNLKCANNRGIYEFEPCDLSLMHSVRSFSQTMTGRLQGLNYLVITSGMLSVKGRTETAEGIDEKLAVHYYGRFLLINQLIPVLEATARSGGEARVLSVFAASRGKPPPLDDLDLKKKFTLKAAGEAAPFYNDVMVDEFSRRHPSISFMHAFPGIVATTLSNNLPWYLRAPTSVLMKVAAKSPQDCGESLLYSLTSPDYKVGCWLLNEHADPLPQTKYHTGENRIAVWEHSLKMTGVAR